MNIGVPNVYHIFPDPEVRVVRAGRNSKNYVPELFGGECETGAFFTDNKSTWWRDGLKIIPLPRTTRFSVSLSGSEKFHDHWTRGIPRYHRFYSGMDSGQFLRRSENARHLLDKVVKDLQSLPELNPYPFTLQENGCKNFSLWPFRAEDGEIHCLHSSFFPTYHWGLTFRVFEGLNFKAILGTDNSNSPVFFIACFQHHKWLEDHLI